MEFISNSSSHKHKHAICELIEWADKCILCTSFLDGKGIKLLSKSISSGIKERCLDITIFSNGQENYTRNCVKKEILTLKGLKHQVTNGEKRLHSKIYYFEKGCEFIVVIGSANITQNGLMNNIEFSIKTTGIIGSKEQKEIHNNFLELESEC